MTMLVDREILKAIKRGEIVLEPFDRGSLGTNSYDVHLAPTLLVYADPFEIDARFPHPTIELEIPAEGRVLSPNQLYLGSTIEYTESHRHVPILNGKSSLGRLGLCVHVTAGTGDVGFCNHWTLELTVVRPLRIYPGMPVAQLLWHRTEKQPKVRYDRKSTAKYNGRDPKPRASEFWRNFSKA
jgi:dCTP deaminase